MHYIADLYYFRDIPNFDAEKAIVVADDLIEVPYNNWLTRLVVGENCKIYSPNQWKNKIND